MTFKVLWFVTALSLIEFGRTERSLDKYNCNRNKPCTQYFRDCGQYYFAYDASDSKFVQCDEWGGCFVMPCALGTVWSSEAYTCVHGNSDNNRVTTTTTAATTTTKFVPDQGKYNCLNKKPCTQYFRDRGQYYFAYDASNSKFVQCDEWGGCFVMPCAPGTVWSSEAYTCIWGNADSNEVTTTTTTTTTTKFFPDLGKYNCDRNKPCTQYFRDRGQYYFAYDASNSKFVQCNEWGGCFVMPCAPGTVWSSEAYTCIHGDSDADEVTTEATTTTTTKFVPDLGKYNCYNKKPCTQDFRDRGQYYFAHEASKYIYIRCDKWGGCYIMPCWLGTVWDSAAYKCVRR
ncbi:hypothetical protein HELRODRAFT_193029 [Helobdella robusta]|uniref:Chitin-binding type-2 domain-containing protein n=1 Tax=Helobdella robusta TaxID=6412 RepID=T1FUJ5_HELRO|nr:hypothetical protein HELRODRAFT_193029 [Helobdella robusta]ESN98284.1 hypothetical protein HELRODRAFT_193029 [Helobdella robusta]